MMAPQTYERLVEWRQEQLLHEAAAERLATQARPYASTLRGKLAISLYELAAWLSAEVADAVHDARSAASIRAVATCDGVEYWRPMTYGRLPR